MYQNTPIASLPEHVSVAMEFANVALDRFDEMDQNEMLAAIRRRWQEHRSMMIKDVEQRLAYLEDSFAGPCGEPAGEPAKIGH